jgi:hypothetical protein
MKYFIQRNVMQAIYVLFLNHYIVFIVYTTSLTVHVSKHDIPMCFLITFFLAIYNYNYNIEF